MGKILLHKGEALIAISVTRLIFWTDWGDDPKIERASMDGTRRIIIVKTSVRWPNAMTIDYPSRRLYWADAKLRKISSCDYEGQREHIVSTSGLRTPFSIAVFEEYVYWSDWGMNDVYSMHRFENSSSTTSLMREEISGPMTVRVYHEQSQPTGKLAPRTPIFYLITDHPFLAPDRCYQANCSQLCLPAMAVAGRINDRNLYACHCQDGNLLATNGRDCVSGRHPARPLLTWNTTQQNFTEANDLLM